MLAMQQRVSEEDATCGFLNGRDLMDTITVSTWYPK
jgi:hypothetical protein